MLSCPLQPQLLVLQSQYHAVKRMLCLNPRLTEMVPDCLCTDLAKSGYSGQFPVVCDASGVQAEGAVTGVAAVAGDAAAEWAVAAAEMGDTA